MRQVYFISSPSGGLLTCAECSYVIAALYDGRSCDGAFGAVELHICAPEGDG